MRAKRGSEGEKLEPYDDTKMSPVSCKKRHSTDQSGCRDECILTFYSSLHLNEERKKVGRNKRSVSGMDEHAGNGLRPYPGLRLRKRYVSSLK